MYQLWKPKTSYIGDKKLWVLYMKRKKKGSNSYMFVFFMNLLKFQSGGMLNIHAVLMLGEYLSNFINFVRNIKVII